MKSLNRSAAVTIGLGILLVVVTMQSFGEFGGGSPSLLSPGPIPLFLLYTKIGPLIFAVPAVAFWLWNVNLFRGERRFPTRTIVLLSLGGITGLMWQLSGGRNGYFSPGWAAISLVMFSSAVVCAVSCRRRPSFALNVIAHWLLFAWLASYAFPWLGEVF